MADHQWDNGAPPPLQRRRWAWLWKTALVFAAVMAGMAVFLFIKAQSTSRQVWPLMRQIAARLQTDEGAKDLWRKNPILKQSYGDEAAFLSQVRAYRPSLAALPDLEPPRDGKEFRAFTGPFNVFLRFHAASEAWVQLVIVSTPFFTDRNLGEGVTQLVFAKDEPSLKARLREARQGYWIGEWKQFRDLELALLQDESAAFLYRQHPGLKTQFPDERAFLEEIKGWRSHLKPLPEDYKIAQKSFRSRRRGGPFETSLNLAYPVDEGYVLHENWRDDELVEIRLEALSR